MEVSSAVAAQTTPSNASFLAREEWLMTLKDCLGQTVFFDADIEVPTTVRVSCGWPFNRRPARKRSARAIGECWSRRCSEDGTSEIFVSPELDNPFDVAGVLVHELIHAVDNCIHGHRGPFKQMALSVGLQGMMTATTPGPELAERLNDLIARLGPYPHAKLNVSEHHKKQRARLVKVICPRCKYAIWTTRMWLDFGTPTCVCSARMKEVTKQ